MSKEIWLKSGREKSVNRHHPWIFSGAIQKVINAPESGETIQICNSSGEFLAWGAYSPTSNIRARIWTWNFEERIDEQFFSRKLASALRIRQSMPELRTTNACRLVHGESDNMPGLIVDQYDKVLSVQFLSAGMEYWREVIISQLLQILEVESIYERSDVEVRALEGLPERIGLIWGEQISDNVMIHENDLLFGVDVRGGHKTGFYLDQRENRAILRQIAEDKRVLDCFCYTGGFSLSALAGGASTVQAVDTSAAALDAAQINAKQNDLDLRHTNWIQGDVFTVLRQMRDRGEKFDLIVLDPPKFAPTKSQVQRAARGYKDINLLAFKLLSPGGELVTFSCSGGLDSFLFQKIVADAALDAGVNARILRRLTQAADHVVATHFPEGEYLKGFHIQVD